MMRRWWFWGAAALLVALLGGGLLIWGISLPPVDAQAAAMAYARRLSGQETADPATLASGSALSSLLRVPTMAPSPNLQPPILLSRHRLSANRAEATVRVMHALGADAQVPVYVHLLLHLDAGRRWHVYIEELVDPPAGGSVAKLMPARPEERAQVSSVIQRWLAAVSTGNPEAVTRLLGGRLWVSAALAAPAQLPPTGQPAQVSVVIEEWAPPVAVADVRYSIGQEKHHILVTLARVEEGEGHAAWYVVRADQL